MATIGGTWIFFNEFKLRLGRKAIDLLSDTFKVALRPSTYVPDIDAQNVWADISEQEISGNGYAQQELASKTWARVDESDAVAWGAAAVSFGPADGGPITARRAVIYNDTTADKCLVAHCLLDATDVDMTAPDGVSLGVSLPLGLASVV